MTMPEQTFRDLMQRTMHNLRVMDRLMLQNVPGEVPPYEVTHLLNSFLGAFALPREQDLHRRLETISISEAESIWGLPQLTDLYPEYPVEKHEGKGAIKPENLDDLVRLFRNGLAHGNLTLLEDDAGDIHRVRVVNYCGCRGCRSVSKARPTPTWGTILDTDSLRRLLEAFVEIADHLYEQAVSSTHGKRT